jgi:hypothetical protein
MMMPPFRGALLITSVDILLTTLPFSPFTFPFPFYLVILPLSPLLHPFSALFSHPVSHSQLTARNRDASFNPFPLDSLHLCLLLNIIVLLFFSFFLLFMFVPLSTITVPCSCHLVSAFMNPGWVRQNVG